jgi:hypothetical protein
MRCHQCERPAIYCMEGKNLCLACTDKLQSIADRQQSIVDRQFLQNAAMLNLSLDEMDAVVGLPLAGGRVPVAALAQAMRGRTVLNNIHVTNSTVGVLNTGDLARIDAAITLTKNTEVESIGVQLQKLTQAIVDTSDLDEARKKEMLDLVQSLAEQVVGPQKPSVMKALLKSIEERAQGVAAIFGVLDGLSAAFKLLFGGAP